MNYFIEGLQGSGKTTAASKITEKYPELIPVREGDYSPVELAWCAYVDDVQYKSIIEKYDAMRSLIKEKTFTEGDKKIICYTKIPNASHSFYSYLEQYEIYNGRRSFKEFRNIIMSRFEKWKGDNMLFECSLFQNIVEDFILFRNMSDDDIIDFYRSIREKLEGKNYRIIYLETEDIAQSISIIKKERSDENGNEIWFQMLCGFFNDSPYAKANGLSGFDGIIRHLQHRQDLELRLCREIFPEYVTILRSKKYEDIIL